MGSATARVLGGGGTVLLIAGLSALSMPGVGDTPVAVVLAGLSVVLGVGCTTGAVLVAAGRDPGDDTVVWARRLLAVVCVLLLAVAAWSTFLASGRLTVDATGLAQFVAAMVGVGVVYLTVAALLPRFVDDGASATESQGG